MPELITLGETMAVMVPRDRGALRYCPDYRLRMAGAESNTAIGVCKLGHTAGWISALGEDALGDYVLSAIRAEGVDVSHVRRDPHRRTGLMLKELGAVETTVYYYRDGSAASALSPADLVPAALDGAKILHLTGITPALSDSCRALTERAAAAARERGLLLSFDPNLRRKLWVGRDPVPVLSALLLRCDIALLGRDEGEALLGTDDPERIAETLLSHGVRLVAVKDGARGAYCADGTRAAWIPPEPCTVVDPVGAGDGFNAGFLCGVLEGADPAACGRMGAIAGAMATETTGDVEGYPTRAQLLRRMNAAAEVYR